MSGINVIRRWVIQSRLKEQGKQGGVMITLPKKEFVDLNTSITADRLLRSGIDIDQLTSVAQVENLVNRINKLSTRVISQDDPRFKGIMDKMMGKRGEVVDMEGKKIPPGSKIMGGKAMDDDLPPPGSRGGPDDIAAPVQSAEESTTNLTDSTIKSMLKMEPIEAMKEANKVIKREGIYKALDEKQAKKILEDTEDHIFERDFKTPDDPDFDPEKMAKGGIARIGLKEGLTPGQQGPIGPVFTTSDPKEAAKEVVKRLIKIEGADIPVSEKLRISLQGLDNATVQGVMKILGGELSFGAGKQGSDKGIGFNYYKSFEKGGIARIGLKDGMNRRTFLKLLGGAISIPIIGRFFKPAKGVGKVSKTPMIKTPDIKGKPEWFDSLVNRVIMEGDDVTKKLATKDREVVHTKKLNDTDEVTVYQDLETDSIRVEYKSPDNMLEEPVDLMYKKTPPDETVPKGSAEFEASEMGFVSRQDGPDDYFIDAEPTGGSTIKDLDSDVSALKEYATGKGPTMKEFVQKKKRKDKVKKLNEGDLEAQSQYVIDRQGDYYDYDDYKKGGLAGMLGE